MLNSHARLFVKVAIALGVLASAPAWAQDFPSKPVTFVVPFGAGSGTDQLTRALAQVISRDYKVPTLVENKAGASGILAAQYVAKAAADGYTLLVTTNTTHAANEHLYKKLPYDPVKDFTPVTLLGKGYMFLVVSSASPARSVSDLIAMAKKAPGKLTFGSGSSSSRVGSEMFKQLTGIDVLHVPYKSNPLAITDLIGGQIDFMFTDAPTALPQINSGKLRALAASGTKRLSAYPNVPTVDEAGVKGYDVSYWTAVYAPAGVPAPLAKRLNEMFVKAATAPEMQAFQTRTSGETVTSTSEELARFQANESQKWGQVIRAAGIEKE